MHHRNHADRRRHAGLHRDVIEPADLIEDLLEDRADARLGLPYAAVALAWGIAVVTELLGAHDGMGKVFSMMLTAQGLDVIIIGIIWVTAVALITDLLFIAISNRWTRWVARA